MNPAAAEAPTGSHQVFATKSPGGFGLIQRERDFSAYQDLFNFYYRTPSVWVRPNGDWKEGEIHLVELPTTYEGLDNVVAFWNPKEQPQPLQPYKFSYTLLWGSNETDMKLNFDKMASTGVCRESLTGWPTHPADTSHA